MANPNYQSEVAVGEGTLYVLPADEQATAFTDKFLKPFDVEDFFKGPLGVAHKSPVREYLAL